MDAPAGPTYLERFPSLQTDVIPRLLMRINLVPALSALVLTACAGADRPAASGPETDTPVSVASPAAPRSGEPFLAPTASGRLLLSWIEALPDSSHALRFSTLEGGAWSAARTIAQGRDWFVNWADFPSIIELPDGSLAAHYLQRSGPGTYAYDVWVTRSRDGGATWGPPVRPHRDGTQTEHGFVTLFPLGEELGAVWLDGRGYAGAEASPGGHGGEMSLRFTTFAADGTAAPESALDLRTCDCCQTTVALTSSGPAVYYRDRSAGEVRDIYGVRLVNGTWTEPKAVHADGWEINQCPVNGPVAAARGGAVALAWFTAARDTPRVNVAFSTDAGATFGPPVRVDAGDPSGRVGVVLDEGAAYVSWLENVGETGEIRVRRVTPAGELGSPVTVASTSAARASGVPRLALHDGALWLAWTQPGDSARVLTAKLPVAGEPRRP